MSVADRQPPNGTQQKPPADEQAAKDSVALDETASDAAEGWPTWQRDVGLLAGVLLPIGLIYYRTVIELVKVWEIDPNYSHGYVVPVFAAALGYLAYTRHEVLPVSENVPRRCVTIGCLEIAFGFLLHLVSVFLGWRLLFIDVVGLIFILLGVLMALGGKKANAVYGFPVFFLIFAAPLPAFVYQKMALPLQHFASIFTVTLFDLIGEPAIRTGYRINIRGDHDMLVGDACSGLRSLTAILALAFAIAYLSGRSMRYRACWWPWPRRWRSL